MTERICERCGRPILYPIEQDRLWRHKVIHPVRVVVRHEYYGCDTGCEGHQAYVVDCDGNEEGLGFQFDSPYSREDAEAWGRDFAAKYAPSVPYDHDHSNVTTDW